MASPLLRHSADVCVDLYVDHVMVPRVALLSLLAAIAIGFVLVVRRYCLWRQQRAQRRAARITYSSVALKSPSTVDEAVSVEKAANSSVQHQWHDESKFRKWFVYLLGASAMWTTIVLLSFQSFEISTAAESALGRPRVVFSFTTIPDGINKIQLTLDALVEQDGLGFDAIYVIVPRKYRKTPVEIPTWLLADTASLERSDFQGIGFATGTSAFHAKVHVVVLDTDFGPASKVLGTLLVEQDPDTLIVYGDDDRVYPSQLCERALHHSARFPNEAVAVLGGWISAEDSLYCGRSLEVGVNRVSFVGGAGGVAVKRKFFGMGRATLPAFAIMNLSKACFLGDDYYLSHVLSANGVPRRIVYDSCWNIENLRASYPHGGLSYAESSHPGGANVEHYQQCIRELGLDQDLSHDGEFGWLFMTTFAHTWGVVRGLGSWLRGDGFVPC